MSHLFPVFALVGVWCLPAVALPAETLSAGDLRLTIEAGQVTGLAVGGKELPVKPGPLVTLQVVVSVPFGYPSSVAMPASDALIWAFPSIQINV